jgi:fructose-1,6-bisphosphatase I
MREAGGAAIDGCRDILDLEPTQLHQRTPLYIGSAALVERARELVAPDSEI